MDTLTTLPAMVDVASDAPVARPLVARNGRGDRVFRAMTSLSGLAVLSIMGAVGLFLAIKATPAFRRSGLSFFTSAEWQPDRGKFGIAGILVGTVLIALVAVSVAVPISLGAALFITEIAPNWMRSTLVALVDLMAAVPSVVYGLWGAYLLQGQVIREPASVSVPSRRL